MTVSACDFAIDTERLRLRPLCEEDRGLYCEMYTDPDTMRWIGPALTVEQASRSLSLVVSLMERQPPATLQFALVDRATERAVGICGTRQFDARSTSLEIGIILRAEARGRGFAAEAKVGLMRQMFKLLPTAEIWVRYQRGNVATERSNLRIGFVPVAGPQVDGDDIGYRRMSVHRNTWAYGP